MNGTNGGFNNVLYMVMVLIAFIFLHGILHKFGLLWPA